MKLNLGKERQERRRVVSIWESSRSRRLATAVLIIPTRLATAEISRANGGPKETKSGSGDGDLRWKGVR